MGDYRASTCVVCDDSAGTSHNCRVVDALIMLLYSPVYSIVLFSIFDGLFEVLSGQPECVHVTLSIRLLFPAPEVYELLGAALNCTIKGLIYLQKKIFKVPKSTATSPTLWVLVPLCRVKPSHIW